MTSETIEIQLADGSAEAYVSRPDEGEYPAVLLFMDAIGLRPRIEDMADRIAGWGYVVLAPNLFYRAGRAADLVPTADLSIQENREAFFADAAVRIKGLPPEKAMADVQTYAQTLLGLKGATGNTIGTTGYCMGGKLSFITACTYPELVDAAGVFHAGGLVSDGEDSPHLGVGNARAELYFGHADNDPSMTAQDIARLEEALEQTSLTYTSTIFEGAAHGYTMADSASYNEAATERHFEVLEDLFARNLR